MRAGADNRPMSGEESSDRYDLESTTTFWSYMCRRVHEFWLMFSMGVLFLLMATVSLLLVPQGSAPYFVAIQVVVVCLVLVGATGGVIYYCNQ